MKISSETIDAIRPEPAALDPDWSHETISAILATEPTRRPRSRRSGRLRGAVVGLALATATVSGAGIAAAATGLTPQVFTDAFAGWKHWPGNDDADPATAVRVAEAPGPAGTVFSVLSTGGENGYGCRTAVFESAESAAEPAPSSFAGVYGDFCSSGPTFPTFGGAGVTFDELAATYVVSAGDAVRAVVSTPDGTTYPALLVGGDFWGWFPKSADPTLVAYAADGSVVGKVKLG